MSFQPVDRLPHFEWAPWWDKTIARWRTEGLPEELGWPDIWPWFGLDIILQTWVQPYRDSFGAAMQEIGPMDSMAAYQRLRPHLYPTHMWEDPGWQAGLEDIARRQEAGEVVVWLTLNGFFWYPRTLFGIERHLLAFYDHPDVMHAMNQDLLEHSLGFLEALNRVLAPDFMTFAEDMSYRSGPMCSRGHFDEFMAPYYRQILPRLHETGTLSLVDTDGDCAALVPWFREVGMEGFLPLERQSGVDLVDLRRQYPDLLMIGGYNKLVMNQGEDAIRAEFERLLPAMRSGGYIPACDHQTPPGVSLEQYRQYLRLMWEYCAKV
jgi:hypothetical protein